MSEENRNSQSENEKEPIHKNFFVRVGVVFISILILYFIISPYQNCMRGIDSERVCINKTNW
jgi:hypothetical protein